MSGAPIRATIELPAGALRIEAPAPAILTQHNCTSYVGLTPGVFLELLRRPDFPLRVIVIGKARGVEAPPFVAWLKRQTERPAVRGIAACHPVAEPDGADEFLAEFGLRAVNGGGR